MLGRYLWIFRKIVGQMQHDLFHVYTVDQHILMVLRNVRRFFIVEHAHEYPFCSQLAGGWDKPWLLYVAALFHDIAKGRGGDHSKLGAMEVRRFCKQHDIEKEDADLIEFVVREHLSMSRVAQKADLSDPDVIGDFAKRVINERYLTALYLFTVADVRGTSPKVWNAWKGKLLEDLYRATSRALGGHSPDLHAEVQERQRDALIELALHSQPFESHKQLWDTLDVSYFMRHDAVEIGWHARMLSRHVRTLEPVVRARPSPVGEGLQVLVYAPDQEDLFARICGYFDHSGFSIQDARIHTTQSGYALDTFQVIAVNATEHYRELISMIEVELTKVISEAGPLPEPNRGRVSRRLEGNTTQGAKIAVAAVLDFGIDNIFYPALYKSNVGFIFAKPLQILLRAGRSPDFQRDAVGREQLGVAPGISIVGARLIARGNRHVTRWCRFDKLIGNDKTDRRNENNRPGRRQQVAN